MGCRFEGVREIRALEGDEMGRLDGQHLKGVRNVCAEW